MFMIPACGSSLFSSGFSDLAKLSSLKAIWDHDLFYFLIRMIVREFAFNRYLESDVMISPKSFLMEKI
jgi:hypothetical protein